MKILLINTFYYNRGGDSTYYFNLEKLLISKGHEVIPFSMKHPLNMSSNYNGYFVDYIDFNNLNKKNFIGIIQAILKSFYSFEAQNKIRSLISDTHPDVAHIQNYQHHLTPSIIYELKKQNIPIVWTLHDYEVLCPNATFLSHGKICEKCKSNRYYNVLLNSCKKDSYYISTISMLDAYLNKVLKVYNNINLFISPSRFLKDKMIEYGYEESKVIHLPNFVEIPKRGKTNSIGSYVLYLGRLSEEKGLYNLVTSFEKLPNIKLHIVGDGPLKYKLLEFISLKKINNIDFMGFLTGAELSAAISNARFIVVPSICYENMPYSIIEAFAYCKPVIASNLGGIPELVINDINGYTYNYNDNIELSKKINRLYNNTHKIMNLGQNGYQLVKEKFNSEVHYSHLLKIYKILNAK